MRIRVFRDHHPSGYIGFTKRMAGNMVTGDFVVEIDHDDDFHPNLFRWILEASKEHPECQFFYTDCAELDENTYRSATYGNFFAFGFQWAL